MSNNPSTQLTINTEPKEKVDEYTYLGQVISLEDRIQWIKRKEKTWRSFWPLNSVIKSEMGIKIQNKNVRIMCLPVLIYGAQKWTLWQGKMEKQYEQPTGVWKVVFWELGRRAGTIW